MKRFAVYLSNYKKESVLGPLFKMLEAGFELFVPLVMAQIIDIGIKNRDLTYILKQGGILLLLGIVGLACSLTAQYYAAKASVGFGTALRNDLFKHINSLSYSELDTIGNATLITRMTSDVNQVQTGLNLALRLLLRSPFIVFGAMLMAFTVNVRAALVFVVAIPLLSIVVFGIMAVSMPMYKTVQRQLDRVTQGTRESLAGIRVIRAFNRQEDEIRSFEADNTQLVKFQVLVGKISALMNPITYVIINLAIIAVLWVGGRQVEDGIITQGETVALVNYMSQILVELIKLANLIVSISKALACGNRITSVFSMYSSITDGQGGNECFGAPGQADKNYGVVFNQVSFRYDKKAREAILSGLNFTIKKGQTVGIIGGTGSGKTSLVNLIPRFYDVEQGAVLVDGRDVRSYALSDLRSKIGIVPQKAVLFKGTLRENMQWGRQDATDEEIYQALTIAQAREFVDSRHQGLELPIAQNGRNLSGGQRQRLTIARALVRKPSILIMDDSASALDFATDAALRKAIRDETGDMTVFIVSQRATTIRHADQIIVLDDGKAVGIGRHQELIENCQVYREICLSQLSREEVQA